MSSHNPTQQILVTERNHYAIITINRATQMNSLSWATLEETAGAMSRLRANELIRAIIVTGAGGIFSSGADLNEITEITPVTAFDFSRRGQAILNLFSSTRPGAAKTIAAIDGHCMGGGLDLALACDLRFATPRSTFAHPGAKRGIITGWGGTVRLPRLVGRAEALRLLVTGDRIDAREALRIGLINELCVDATERAREYSDSLARHPEIISLEKKS
ncbi:MAG TPA: enoyl-CoA hydratase/isomerase family protein [Blastocatellia bacterium]|nr:enoyl-CoA hydratase/isomerase family protein [Blastocatellia bacterium]